MARYDFNVSQAPAGVCAPKLARQIKNALGLGRKPKIEYQGTNFPGTDNLQTGTFTVQCRVLTTPEEATLLLTVQTHDICAPFNAPDKDDVGIDVDDLEDHFLSSMPGQVLYVRDLDRLTSGKGCLVYRTRNGWRRVSNDTEVIP